MTEANKQCDSDHKEWTLAHSQAEGDKLNRERSTHGYNTDAKNAKPGQKIDANIAKGIANKATVRDLHLQGYSKKEIIKITQLHDQTVGKYLRAIRKTELGSPKTVSRAHRALIANLEKDNMQAVKLVYDHINDNNGQNRVSGSNTTININFDGLINKGATEIIDSKVSCHVGATDGLLVGGE